LLVDDLESDDELELEPESDDELDSEEPLEDDEEDSDDFSLLAVVDFPPRLSVL
jgi:hypothetical protein